MTKGAWRFRSRRVLAAVLVGSGAAAWAWAVVPANASFPGSNGRLVFAYSDHGIKCSQNDPTSDAFNLYTINPDGSGKTQLTNDTSGATIQSGAWSPDGTKLAYTRITCSSTTLHTSDSAGGSVTSVGTVPPGSRRAFWSPDGSRLGYHTVDGDIFTVKIDGTDPVAAESSAKSCSAGSWKPDGTRIAFWCSDGQGNFTVEVANPDGTGRAVLGSGTAPDWSPDGKRIAFVVSTQTSQGVWTMAADGTDRREVTPGGIDVRWAPDGGRLVIAGGSPGIFTINSDGTGKTAVFDDDAMGVDWQVQPGTAGTTTSSSSTSTSTTAVTTSTSPAATSTTTGTPSSSSTTTTPPTDSSSPAPTTATTSAVNPSIIDQTPASGAPLVIPGDEIEVVATGFGPATTGDVLFASTPRKVGTFVADGIGTVRSKVTIPRDAGTGLHHVLLAGVNPGGQPRTVSIGVRVQTPAGIGALARTGTAQAMLVAGIAVLLGGVLLRRLGRHRI